MPYVHNGGDAETDENCVQTKQDIHNAFFFKHKQIFTVSSSLHSKKIHSQSLVHGEQSFLSEKRLWDTSH